MAEGMIKLFAEKLRVMVVEEYKYLRGVEGQVISLRDELEWISSFLRDAAVHRNKYERVDVWVSQIRDLAYDAEDILEMFIHKVKRLREKNIRGLINYPSRLITLHKLGNQIDSINNRIERISKYKSKYAIDKLEDENSLGKDVALNKRIKAPDVEEDDVVGFKIQSDEVIQLLFEKEEESSQLHVVSIVGMPGTGKSTLAHKVFNDVKKENKFDSHAWIDVSQEFESQKLLKVIKESKGKEKENLGNKDQNRGKEENPMEKGMGKLLVVFDDVRRTEDWDELLSDVLKKIKSEEITVLLTSRSTEVGTHANSRIEPHEIRPLNGEAGLELLKKKVFHEGNYPKNLKKLAKKIVKKCDGLPLAIVVLGGLLSMKPKTVDVWSKVLDSANWQLLQGPTKRLEVVALSYDDLPNFLKPCFLYFGLFPVDKLIDCEMLIQLWIAEGFIQERGEEAMEDVAEDYLEELAQRNMIRVGERHYDGSPSTCRIQGLFRELAISKGRQDKFIDIMGSKRKATRHTMSRRIGFHAAEEEESEGVKIPVGSSFNNPRSVLCFSKLNNVRLLEDKSFNKSFKLLRVLDLQGATNLWSLPDEIGNLVLLKYLNLRGLESINRLPSSIRNLRRLQTLYIDGTGIVCIPWSICKLEELRHFYSYSLEQYMFGGSSNSSDSSAGLSCNNLLHRNGGSCGGRLPQIQRLRNLRTLCTRAENWTWDDFSQLTNLRILRLWGLNMDLHGEALSTWIAKFIYLRELSIEGEGEGKLQFPDSFSQHVHLYSMSVTAKMGKLPNTFPPNLTTFELFEMALNQEEGDDLMNTLAALKNLKELDLNGICFPGKSHIVIPAGGFRNLTDLSLRSLPDLEELKVEEGSLPNLKSLWLDSLSSLRELPDGLRQLTNLQDIWLCYMPQKIADSVKGKVGDDWEKIKHIPTVQHL